MTFEEHRAALITYLRAKVDAEDWHGVSDAANDLRELEAERRGFDRRTEQVEKTLILSSLSAVERAKTQPQSGEECHFNPEKAACFWPQCPTKTHEICKLQWRGSFLKRGGNY